MKLKPHRTVTNIFKAVFKVIDDLHLDKLKPVIGDTKIESAYNLTEKTVLKNRDQSLILLLHNETT